MHIMGHTPSWIPLTLLLYKPVSHPPVSFLEDEDCLMAFSQFGAGSNIWKSDKHYTLWEMTTRKVLKFNPTDIDYYLSLKPQSNGVPHIDQLCEIFHSMVYEMTTGMAQWPRPLWSAKQIAGLFSFIAFYALSRVKCWANHGRRAACLTIERKRQLTRWNAHSFGSRWHATGWSRPS